MKLGNIFIKTTSLITMLMAAVTVQSFATTHVINFGNTLGRKFSPDALSVNVGDTIKWVGPFGFHEIQSVSVPNGALSFGPTSSSISFFIYVVTVPGKYDYHCNFHFPPPDNMIGSFTAGGSAAVQQIFSNAGVILEENFPNPSNGMTTIRYILPHSSEVSLKIYDMNGKEMKEVLHTFQNSGNHEVLFDGSGLPGGTYTYQLKTSNGVLSERMILIK